MTLRKAHGRAAELGRLLVVETSPVDELPEGVRGPDGPPEPAKRRQDGTLTVEGARALGKLGGKAKAQRCRFAAKLADHLGLAEGGDEMRPYVDAAAEWATAQLRWLAESVGGGEVGPGPASIVHSAALALAASRYAYQRGSETGDAGMLAQGARLADQSRASLLTAHELCAREAKARKRDAPLDLGVALSTGGSGGGS